MIARYDAQTVVKNINDYVMTRARRFVWASDRSQEEYSLMWRGLRGASRADRAKPIASYCFMPCMAAIACSAGLKAALARLEWSSPILVACATKAAYDVLAYSDWI